MLTMLLWWHTKLTEFGGSVDRPFPCLQGVQIYNNHKEDEYHDSFHPLLHPLNGRHLHVNTMIAQDVD